MKVLFYPLLFLQFCLFAGAAEVYRTVDEDGNVTFTDQPSDDAEKIEVQDVMTIPAMRDTAPYNPPAVAEPRYRTLELTAPEEDQTYFRSEGALNVSVRVNPRLRTGDTLVLYLDGNEVQRGRSPAFVLPELDRGTHQVKVAIVDAMDNTVIESRVVSFHMRQNSIRNPQNPQNRPPAPR